MAGTHGQARSGPVRTAGTGAGGITGLPWALGTAGPSACGSTGCYRGAYQTPNGVGGNRPARAASKRGTFQFTYTETLNGKTTPPATVTITVN